MLINKNSVCTILRLLGHFFKKQTKQNIHSVLILFQTTQVQHKNSAPDYIAVSKVTMEIDRNIQTIDNQKYEITESAFRWLKFLRFEDEN